MKKSTLTIHVALLSLMIAGSAVGQTAPDNTKSNAQDSSNREMSADHQSNNAADVDLAKKIRRSIVDDKSLSTYGHNVKIIAMNGTVTLNGVVRSDEEKRLIGKKAASVAGEGHVVDHLKVAPAQ